MNDPKSKLVTMKVKPAPHRKLATLAAKEGLGMSEALEEAVDAWEGASAGNPKRRRHGVNDALKQLHGVFGKPPHIVDAMTYVVDTLDVAWVAALETFGAEASPTIALEIYDRIHRRRLEIVEERRVDHTEESEPAGP